MSFTIDSDTLVKIIIRRGQNSERANTLFSLGELGYTVDTQRVFVGDGLTSGGIPVSNFYLGTTSNADLYSSIANSGDTLFENNILKAYNGTTWSSIHPLLDNISLVKRSSDNALRVSTSFVGDGFNLAYSDAGSIQNLSQSINQLQFDSRYISLCAAKSSFYFGNINNRTVTNSLCARVNIDNSLFINDSNSNPNQIQIYAKDPVTGWSSVQALSGTFFVAGQQYTAIGTNLSGQYNNIIINGTTHQMEFYGNSEFNNFAAFDNGVTVSNTLCAINTQINGLPALLVKTTAVSAYQPIALFQAPSGNSVLTVSQGPFVGINTAPNINSSSGYLLYVNGNTNIQGSISASQYLGLAVLPIGAVIDFGGSAAPTGWLICNGTQVSRSTYAALYAVIGTTYGVGDGSSTFNLPNSLGRVTVGAGAGSGLTSRTLGALSGEEVHTLNVAELPSHNHPEINGGTFTCGETSGGVSITAGSGGNNYDRSTTGNTGGGAAHNNMQPYLVLNKIIKF